MEQIINNIPIKWVQVTDPVTKKVYYAPTSYVNPPKEGNDYTNIENVNIGNAIISASLFLGTTDESPYIIFYKGDGSEIISSLNVFASTSSYAITAESASYALTASYALNGGGGGSGSTDTGSLLVTASFSNPNLEFEKGNGSGFAINLSSLTVTSSLTASFINGGTF